MLETAVKTICLLLFAGQAFALLRSRRVAVLYYISVAPLSYLSFWAFVTWDPNRGCGLLLAAGGLLLYARPKRLSMGFPLILLLLGYLVVSTLANSTVWPTEYMAGRSAAYGQLRGLIQIFNWVIFLGAGWQIAIALAETGAFEKARKVIIRVGICHCIYAIYQVAAYLVGLPVTGIRRPASDIGMTLDTQQYAIFQIAGLRIFRANSLVGEPKDLGALSFVWIAALLTFYIEGKRSKNVQVLLILALFVLGLTYSTTAWAVLPIVFALALYASNSQRRSRMKTVLVPILCLIGLVVFAESAGLMPDEVSIKKVFAARLSDRIQDPFTDPPVEMSLQLLSENPRFALLGTGLGGISFYIAESLGGGQDKILFPNIGFVGLICDMGVVGMLLLLFALSRGIRNFIAPGRWSDTASRHMAFMGCVFLTQSLVYWIPFLCPLGIGLLLASELRSHRLAAQQMSAHSRRWQESNGGLAASAGQRLPRNN